VVNVPQLEILHLSYDYPDGHQALMDISFQVDAGEHVALIGANGAGKSTLLMHLNGTLQGSGEVRISGLSISRSSLGLIRAQVGIVFQNPDDQLFSPTVFEDVAFGPMYQGLSGETIRKRVTGALAQVGMSWSVDRTPYTLSYGEKKRVALATVLSMQPEVLALDEPTVGLDPRGKREMKELLKHQSQTLMIATHDLELVRDLTSRALLLSSGKLVAVGDTSEILSDEDLLSNHGMI
jgi:cobalt/nickel transport system ATP-binding protein